MQRMIPVMMTKKFYQIILNSIIEMYLIQQTKGKLQIGKSYLQKIHDIILDRALSWTGLFHCIKHKMELVGI